MSPSSGAAITALASRKSKNSRKLDRCAADYRALKSFTTSGLRLFNIMQIPELSASDLKRFWVKVNKDGTIPAHKPELGKCWLWTAATCRGYGKFQIGGHSGKLYIATRVSYFIHTEQQPDPFHTLHHCDNPACVNPKHLWLGTDADNAQDCKSKGRNFIVEGDSCPYEKRQRGSEVPMAKLDEEKVMRILELIKQGVPNKDIAIMFNMSRPPISFIKTGKTWKHVQR